MKSMLERIDYSNPDNKHKMNDLFVMSMSNVKETNEELYEHIKCEIYEIVYGKRISEDMAEKWVHQMVPMAKWTKEDVTNVVNSYSMQIPVDSAYVLFNMLYSDSSNIYGSGDDEESLSKYIQGVKDWYFDNDAVNGEEKLYNYWKYIVKY